MNYLGTINFLNFLIARAEDYEKKDMDVMSKFSLNIVAQIQEEAAIEHLMYRDMKVKYDFEYSDSYSIIESITSNNIQDYLRHTAFRENDFQVTSDDK